MFRFEIKKLVLTMTKLCFHQTQKFSGDDCLPILIYVHESQPFVRNFFWFSTLGCGTIWEGMISGNVFSTQIFVLFWGMKVSENKDSFELRVLKTTHVFFKFCGRKWGMLDSTQNFIFCLRDDSSSTWFSFAIYVFVLTKAQKFKEIGIYKS